MRKGMRDTLSTAIQEQAAIIANVSEECSGFDPAMANTSEVLLASMDGGFSQLGTSVQQNQLTITAQLENLRKTVTSEHIVANQGRNKSLSIQRDMLESLNRLESTLYSINNKTVAAVKDLVTEANSKTATQLQALMAGIFLPKVCKEGMVSISSQGSFPYPLIFPSKQGAFQFPHLCDPITDNGGWILIQRRTTGDINFHRKWADYKTGFGYLDNDFWLGNDNIHTITRTGTYELRIELRSQGKTSSARYSTFSVSDEKGKYTLRLGTFSGTSGDSLRLHNNHAFSTVDRDNDGSEANCAAYHKGGWWFSNCDASNLNGDWKGPANKGIEWETFVPHDKWIIFTEMKIRRVD
ncbi:tenascin-R [Elysia marginata]|uniref:Tenascin-R n=1 Tax=Elysia marginata TaxID=1093978 RepID=A0AAV4JZV2_9GAST|nr:tenascin-R [Elysia marginata]